MDGLWNSGFQRERNTQSELTRHRLLRVNTSIIGTLNAGDASSFAGTAPGLINSGSEGGPHFVMSGRTPDNSKSYGFEFTLLNPSNGSAEYATGPFTVTVWELIGTAQYDQASVVPTLWSAFLPLAAVNYNELYHSFDVNATSIRFQLTPTVAGSVVIAFSEL